MLLTDGPSLVRTPTYWAFDLYTDHHDAMFVDAQSTAGDTPATIGASGEYTVSVKDDAYTISLTKPGPGA
jgi:alpha-L-arabinofuranosidase